jgi:hypothetical protein
MDIEVLSIIIIYVYKLNLKDCLAKTMEKGGLDIMFRGVSLKLVYNAAYILNLRNLYDVKL